MEMGNLISPSFERRNFWFLGFVGLDGIFNKSETANADSKNWHTIQSIHTIHVWVNNFESHKINLLFSIN